MIHDQPEADFSGVWAYAVEDTPYGNFYGNIYLDKPEDTYVGKIINDQGIEYTLEVVRIKGNQVIMKSNLEETNSVMMCKFDGDAMEAALEVSGDDFQYVLKAKRTEEEYVADNQ